MRYAIRFVSGVYLFTRPAYRLAQNMAERASIDLLIARFVAARALAVVGRLTNSTFLTKQSSRVADEESFCVQGTKFYVDLKAGEMFSFEEIYHERMYDRVAGFISQRGWTVFDIGANIGVFAIQQARRGAYVYAFEPNPDCYHRLSRAVLDNNLAADVHVLNLAAGSLPGRGTLQIPEGVTCIGSVVPQENLTSTQEPAIQITSLDHIVPTLGIARIDLLKIDTEGAEVEVLRGADRTLGMVERVILEYHSTDLLRQASELLQSHGFSHVLQIDSGPGIDRGVLYAQKMAARHDDD